MAPEVTLGRAYDEKVDVFAFGLIAWEVYAGTEPFPELLPTQSANVMAYDLQRPSLSAVGDMPSKLRVLMQR